MAYQHAKLRPNYFFLILQPLFCFGLALVPYLINTNNIRILIARIFSPFLSIIVINQIFVLVNIIKNNSIVYFTEYFIVICSYRKIISVPWSNINSIMWTTTESKNIHISYLVITLIKNIDYKNENTLGYLFNKLFPLPTNVIKLRKASILESKGDTLEVIRQFQNEIIHNTSH